MIVYFLVMNRKMCNYEISELSSGDNFSIIIPNNVPK